MREITPVTAAGGILFNADGQDTVRILIIYRRGIWDLPKGKLESGETVSECARREVAEEVGCPLPDAFEEITTTYHEYVEGDRLVGKTTHWFPMSTDTTGEFKPDRIEGIQKVGWFSPGEAKMMVGFPNLRVVIDKFEKWYEVRGDDT